MINPKARSAIRFLFLLLFSAAWVPAASAQLHYTISDTVATLTVYGTSTLHDWSMTSKHLMGHAEFDTASNFQLTALPSLTVMVPILNLKSDNAEMDKNAYATLKARQFNHVFFKLTSATITPADTNAIQNAALLHVIKGIDTTTDTTADTTFVTIDTSEYSIVARGYLAIAGVTKPAILHCTARVNWDGSISVGGTTTLNMTDFGITPPTFMLGAMKTGTVVTINFALMFVRKNS